MTKITISNSLEQTKKVGYELGAQAVGGEIFLLSGELGTGKTALTKGLAEYFGIKDEITSPTFTLMNLYPVEGGKNIKNLIHIDTYRLENEAQLRQIGVEDYLGQPDTICAVEWPEKIQGLLEGKKTISVEIRHLGNLEREIAIK